jgi:hypothetical protein
MIGKAITEDRLMLVVGVPLAVAAMLLGMTLLGLL